MKNGLENIDEVFKQAFDGFESNVDPSVWNNIQSSIGSSLTPQSTPSAAQGIVGKSLAIKIVAGVVLIGAVATATYFVLPKANKNVIAEKVVVENKVNKSTEVKSNPVIKENHTIKKEKVLSNKEIITENISTAKTTVAAPVADITPQTETTTSAAAVNNIVAPSNTANMDGDKEKTQKSDSKSSSLDSKTENKSSNNRSIEPETLEEQVTQVSKFQILIPNVITPNGDGMNDVIKIPGENIEKLELVIMDKTGKPVFTFKTIEDVFEGKDQTGDNLLPGVYYMAGVVIDINGDSHTIKKSISIY